jgi:hypothetical protein
MLADMKRRWQNLYKPVFQEVASRTDLPDMDVILSLLDEAPGGAGVLKVEGTIGEDFLAVPRSVGDFDIPSWASYYNEQKQKCKNRTNKFVFRGGITGAVYSYADVRSGNVSTLRYKVISQTRSDIIDAGFTNVDAQQTDNVEGVTKILQERGLMKNWLTDEEQLCYAGVLVIDGNSLPDRFPNQLAYGIPNVFLHTTDADEYWYHDLRPGIDYVAATPETLVSQVEALVRNETLAATIGRNGQMFVINNLNQERLICYMQQALEEYAKVFTFDPSHKKGTCKRR